MPLTYLFISGLVLVFIVSYTAYTYRNLGISSNYESLSDKCQKKCPSVCAYVTDKDGCMKQCLEICELNPLSEQKHGDYVPGYLMKAFYGTN